MKYTFRHHGFHLLMEVDESKLPSGPEGQIAEFALHVQLELFVTQLANILERHLLPLAYSVQTYPLIAVICRRLVRSMYQAVSTTSEDLLAIQSGRQTTREVVDKALGVTDDLSASPFGDFINDLPLDDL